MDDLDTIHPALRQTLGLMKGEQDEANQKLEAAIQKLGDTGLKIKAERDQLRRALSDLLEQIDLDDGEHSSNLPLEAAQGWFAAIAMARKALRDTA